MITHVVIVQPKPDTSTEAIQTVLEQIRDLQQIIPEIQQVQVGKNIGHHQQGYTYGLIMQFAGQAQLQTYLMHPAHQAVAREILQACESFIEFDLAQ